MGKATVQDIDVKGKRVLVRVDFNVPLDEQGCVTDDTRIRATLPTINYLIEQNAKIILMSHLGRPKGDFDAKFTIKPVAEKLSEILGREVKVAKDCVSLETRQAAYDLQPGEILFLENTRFYPAEMENDREFAKNLAALAEVYVNDAFGVVHRVHSSTVGVTEFLPGVAGFHLKKELSVLKNVLYNPPKPFTAVIGGAKVSDKLGALVNLLNKVDKLLVGGGMANTFLLAKGLNMGDSLVEKDKVDLAKSIIEQAHAKKVNLLLPTDLIVAEKISEDAEAIIVEGDVPKGLKALDIGPKTAERFAEVIKKSQLVLWNGPMGVFEIDKFAHGTEVVARAVAACSGKTVVGGGDSVAAIKKVGVLNEIYHISTGGGASLGFLEGKTLPGVAALRDK